MPYSKYALDKWKKWFAEAKTRDLSFAIFREAIEETETRILKYIPDRFFTEELALFAIDRYGGLLLRDIPRKFRTKTVCLAAAKRNSLEDVDYVKYAKSGVPLGMYRDEYEQAARERAEMNTAYSSTVPPESQTPELVFEALLAYPSNNIARIVPELLSEPFCYMALAHYACVSLNELPRKQLTPGLCQFALAKESKNLQYVPPELMTRETCYMVIIDHQYDAPPLQFVPDRFKDYELCLMAVREFAGSLEFVPEEHKTEELCRDAFSFVRINKNRLNIEKLPLHVPEKYFNEEFCLFMVKRIPGCFKYIPDRFKTPALCLTALKESSNLNEKMKDLPDSLLPEELCVTLLKMKGSDNASYILKCIPRRLRSFAICMEAVKLNGDALDSVPQKFQANEELLEMAYKKSQRPRK
jgi:hypothetical protein